MQFTFYLEEYWMPNSLHILTEKLCFPTFCYHADFTEFFVYRCKGASGEGLFLLLVLRIEFY